MDILRRGWETWKRFARFLGDWIGRVILSVFYFTLFAPFGLAVRLWSDPLSMKQDQSLDWLAREDADTTLSRGRRMF